MKDVTQKSAGRGNESAFPQPSDGHSANGLTIREHFAAMVMQGLCSNHMTRAKAEEVAAVAVICADALIAELSRVSP